MGSEPEASPYRSVWLAGLGSKRKLGVNSVCLHNVRFSFCLRHFRWAKTKGTGRGIQYTNGEVLSIHVYPRTLMESSSQDMESHGSPKGPRSRSRSHSPGSAPKSETGQSSPHRWTIRSRSMGKLKEWGEYAKRICEEKQLRRDAQALLAAALPHLQAQKLCPWCVTRGHLGDWEGLAERIAVELQHAENEGCSEPHRMKQVRTSNGCVGEGRPGNAGGPHPPQKPLKGLWRLPAPIPWNSRGGGWKMPHEQ